VKLAIFVKKSDNKQLSLPRLQ